MSLKRNILASYASQIYVTLVGILILPLYLKYMGAEAYGLVGFFTMLQAWFNLLDMGLTPTVARETARFRGGATDALSYRACCARCNSSSLPLPCWAVAPCLFFPGSSQEDGSRCKPCRWRRCNWPCSSWR